MEEQKPKSLVDRNYVAKIDPLATILLGKYDIEEATKFLDELKREGTLNINEMSGWLATRVENLTLKKDFPYETKSLEYITHPGCCDGRVSVTYAKRKGVAIPNRWHRMSVFKLLAYSWCGPEKDKEREDSKVRSYAEEFRKGDIIGNTYYVGQTLDTLEKLGFRLENLSCKASGCGARIAKFNLNL